MKGAMVITPTCQLPDVDKPEPVTLNDVKNRNSLKKFPMLQQFVERHTKSRQYSFQVCFGTLLKKVV